jgi:hypothetical protein
MACEPIVDQNWNIYISENKQNYLPDEVCLRSTFGAKTIEMVAEYWRPDDQDLEVSGPFTYAAFVEGDEYGNFCIGKTNEDHLSVTGMNCPLRD